MTSISTNDYDQWFRLGECKTLLDNYQRSLKFQECTCSDPYVPTATCFTLGTIALIVGSIAACYLPIIGITTYLGGTCCCFSAPLTGMHAFKSKQKMIGRKFDQFNGLNNKYLIVPSDVLGKVLIDLPKKLQNQILERLNVVQLNTLKEKIMNDQSLYERVNNLVESAHLSPVRTEEEQMVWENNLLLNLESAYTNEDLSPFWVGECQKLYKNDTKNLITEFFKQKISRHNISGISSFAKRNNIRPLLDQCSYFSQIHLDCL